MFAKRHDEDEVLRCSFCSKNQDQVDTLISNPSERSRRVYICNECVEVCNEVLVDHRKPKSANAFRASMN
jgi:ATP-dependent Clp protease ATP-binding subunit ClpX